VIDLEYCYCLMEMQYLTISSILAGNCELSDNYIFAGVKG
jgi:hypothetical protein